VSLLALVAAALAAQVELEVQPRQLEVGQTVDVRLTVTDGAVRGTPEVPVDDGLTIAFGGQSSQHIIVNFRATRSVTYQYDLTAMRPGTFEVGPVSLVIDGQTMTAEAVTVKVSPRSAGDKTGARATLSDPDPWLGQVVIYKFEARYDQGTRPTEWQDPTYDGFVQVPSVEPEQPRYSVSEDGVSRVVQEINVPLVAVGQGHHTITPGALRGTAPDTSARRGRNRGFEPWIGLGGDVKSVTLAAPAVEADIRPLPLEGKPPDFSGLVGSFTIRQKASESTVPLGESVAIEITLEGNGSLTSLRLPPAPRDAKFRAYDDDPEVSAVVKDGEFVSRALVERAVVPEEEGPLTIPGLSLSYFDPEKGAYGTLTTEPVEIVVTPGEQGGGAIASFADGEARQGRAVESLGDDILPPPSKAKVHDQTFDGAVAWMIGMPAIPLLGILGLAGARMARGRVTAPWVRLDRRLASLPSEGRLAALEDIFREACALLLGRPAPALDRAAVEPLGERAASLYQRLVEARYGGDTAALDAIERDVRDFVARRGAA
jgi:hypothetical protein